MAVKLLCLNIERDMHLPKVISLLEKEQPEVVCLQEVWEPDFKMLKEKFGFTGFFVPMLRHPRIEAENSKKELVRQGIAYFTRLPLLKSEHAYYVGEGSLPLEVNQNDIDRVLVKGVVEKNGRQYTIATTHFTWVHDGLITNPEQLRDVQQLLTKINHNEEMILCGDFNSHRGGEIYTTLSKRFKDNIPAHIKTTIDPHLHRAGALQLVVDQLWSTPKYQVNKVKIIDGVSDHMAILAEIDNP